MVSKMETTIPIYLTECTHHPTGIQLSSRNYESAFVIYVICVSKNDPVNGPTNVLVLVLTRPLYL